MRRHFITDNNHVQIDFLTCALYCFNQCQDICKINIANNNAFENINNITRKVVKEELLNKDIENITVFSNTLEIL